MIRDSFNKVSVVTTFVCGLSFLLLASMVIPANDIAPYIEENTRVVNSVNPAFSNTGAPAETNCTSCHSGLPLSPAGVVNFDLGGLSNGYKLDSVYNLALGVSSGPKNGFQLTILDVFGNKAGDLTAGANSSVQMSAGREYISQTSSLGETSFPFEWQAPSTDMGDLFVYYAFNKSDNSGDNTGDIVYVGQELVEKHEVISVEEIQTESGVKYAELYTNECILYADFNLLTRSKVKLSVFQLDGRIIYQKNLGTLDSGKHSVNYSIESKKKHEIVLIQLQVENKLITKKVVFN